MPRENYDVPPEAMAGMTGAEPTAPPGMAGAVPKPPAGGAPGDSGEAQVLQAVQTLAVFAASLQEKKDPKATGVMAGLKQIADALGAGAGAPPQAGPDMPPPPGAEAPMSAAPPGGRSMNANKEAMVL